MDNRSLREIPSLPSLRAFETAARHLNFRKAAEELSLTPSAVSHQIKSLETYLNVTLFKRLSTNVELTEVGQKYFRDIGGPLANLALVSREISKFKRYSAVLTVSLLPTLATRWLIPRLSSFQKQYPDIDLRLSTSVSPVNFYTSDVDMAIRYGTGKWPKIHCEHIFDETIFPVCSPAFFKNCKGKLKKSGDLIKHSLLHNSSHPKEWDTWLNSPDMKKTVHKQSLTFTSSELSLRAAVEGLGIALGRSPLVNEEIESGRLVKIFDPLDDTDHNDHNATKKAYYLVCLPEALEQPNVVVFRKWLLDIVNT